MTDDQGNGKQVVLYAGPAAALARYGETAIVRAVAKRVELYHPDFAAPEALAVAQAAVYHDLDPDPAMNELHAWVDTGNQKVIENGIERWKPMRRLVIMRGKRGDDNTAAENLAAMGSYVEAPRYRLVTDEDERARLGVGDGDMVYEARVSHYRETQDWLNRRAALRLDEKLPSKEIDDRIGKEPPFVAGLGILTKLEMDKLNQQTRNKYPHPERCMKRAKKAAMDKAGWLRRPQRQLDVQSIDLSKFTVDAEWVKDLGRSERTPEETREAGRRGSAALYEAPPSRPWNPQQVRDALRESTRRHERAQESATEKQRGLALGVLTVIYGGGKAGNDMRHHAMSWLFGVESGKDLTGPQILALLDWLKLTKHDVEGEEKWVPCEHMAKEAPAVFERWLADQPGQQQAFTDAQFRVPTSEEA